MKLNIQLTPEDYIKANFLHMCPRPVIKWAGYLLLTLIFAVLAISASAAIANSGEISAPIWIFAGLAYIGFIFGFWTPWRCRKTFRQQKTLQLPYSYEFTEEFVIAKAEYGEAKQTWDFFRKWKEGKDIFTIYQSDPIMQMIPKRVFSSPEEVAYFRDLLTRKIGAACP